LSPEDWATVASAAVAAALFLTVAPARAQAPAATPSIVALEMDGCPAIPPAAVRRALEVEAGVRLQERSAPTGTAHDATATGTLVVRCDADRAFLTVEGTTGGRLERQLALGELANDTAPRLLALAALELLAAQDPALRRKLADAEVTVAPTQVPPASRTTVRAGAVYRTFSAPSGVGAWGGQVSVSRAIGTRLGVTGGLEVSGARRPTPLGESTAVLASGSAAAHWRTGGEHFGVRVEGGARGGLVRLSGAAGGPAVAAATVVRPWAGPFAAAHLLVERGDVSVDLAVETGVAVVSATGLVNDMAALEVRGVWLALSLSLGLRL
jgi:hypothetical protein